MKKLEYVKEYYGYSNEKANALSILTKEQIETIKNPCKRVEKKMTIDTLKWSQKIC